MEVSARGHDGSDELYLLRRVIAGNQRAWDEFFRRFQSVIACRADDVLRRYGTLSGEARDDLISEAWVALLRDGRRRLRLYDPARCPLRSWIRMLATRAMIDYLRTHAVPASYIEDQPELESRLVDTRQPDAGVHRRQQAELARRALGRLNAEDQRFARYLLAEKLQPSEIADEMGICVTTVHTRKHRLCRKLTRLVGRIGPAFATSSRLDHPALERSRS